MHWLVTGMNGTVAPQLATALRDRGDEVSAWDRDRVPPGDEQAVVRLFEETTPDGVCHLAMGSPDWAAGMARACAERGIPYLFTSSVSVFGPEQRAPLGVEVEPTATDDYGRYKRECELAVAAANPEALVVRLGWQIGDAPGSNTMTDHLARRAADGVVEASTAWFPSCAFLPDTAAALVSLIERGEHGLFQLEGNPGLSFHEIATRLALALGADWRIAASDDVQMDNRMLDPRVTVSPITDRLP